MNVQVAKTLPLAEHEDQMAEKAYWWVSVGGNPCEPAVLVHGTKKVYTFGCPDPFNAESEHIEMVKEMTSIPDTPAEAARKQAAWDRQRERDLKAGIAHGYRRFP